MRQDSSAAANGFHGLSYLVAAVLLIALAAVVILLLRGRRTGAGPARQAGGTPARLAARQLRLPAGPGRDRPGAGRQRRALQQAVDAAEFAVVAAQQEGAQTGELDVLCRRLRLAAQDADRSLSLGRSAQASVRWRSPQPSVIGELLTAASLIQDAAASAAASHSRPAGRRPAYDPRPQAEAIAARIASAAQAIAGISPAGG